MIKYISENRDLDIYVADCGAGAVVVVNQAAKIRRHSSPTKNKLFSEPKVITADSQGRNLTTN